MSGIDGLGFLNGELRTPVSDEQPAGSAVHGGCRNGSFMAAVLMPHILLDGMAATSCLERVGSVYEALLQGAVPSGEAPPGFDDHNGRNLQDFDTRDMKHCKTTRLQNMVSLDFNLTPALDGRYVRNTLFPAGQETSAVYKDIPQAPV